MVDSKSFSYERYPRIATLGQSLKITIPDTLRSPRSHVCAADNDWNASGLLLKFLLAASPLRPFLDSERAQDLLSTAGSTVHISDLQAGHWIRFVLGQLEIPAATSFALHAPNNDRNPIPKDMQEPIRLLYEARYYNKDRLWVAVDTAKQVRQVHALAHLRTPDLDTLVALNTLSPLDCENAPGYSLSLHRTEPINLWEFMGSRVLGLYWEEIERDPSFGSGIARLNRWLQVATEIPDWGAAGEYMTPESRKRFIRAAQERILGEPDLFNSTSTPELERVRRSTHAPFGVDLRIDLFPDRSASPLEVWHWWQQFHNIPIRDDCRQDLNSLIAMVVGEDNNDVQAPNVTELLLASMERPHLGREVALFLLFGARVAIAGLIAKLETASFGMHLLQELDLSESNAAQHRDFATRQRVAEQQRMSLWRDALPVLLGTLIYLRPEQEEARVRALGEVLLSASNSTFKHSRRADTHEILCRSAEERFELLVQGLSSIESLLIDAVTPDLLRFLRERAAARLKTLADFESMPAGTLRVLFALMRTVASSTLRTTLEPVIIANEILALYKQELERWLTPDGSNVVSWIDDVPEIQLLPWAALTVVLHLRDEAHRIVGPSGVEFDAILKSIPMIADAAARGRSGGEHASKWRKGLFFSWVHKVRLHLKLLFHIHEGVSSNDDDLAMELPTQSRVALITIIEERVQALLSSCVAGDKSTGQPGLFELDLGLRVDDPTAELNFIDQVTRGINRFSEICRERAYSAWIMQEREPVVLLKIIESALPLHIKSEATDKLMGLNLDEHLEQQMWLPHIEQIAESANLAGRSDIAERVINYGDQVKKHQRAQDEWEAFAFRMRLIIAYRNKDETSIRTLPLPPSAEKHRIKIDGRDVRSLDNTRDFYLALLLLDKEPEHSHEIFERLLANNPGSASDAVNRFAASLRVARKAQDPDDRRLAFSHALREWEAVEPSIPRTSLEQLRVNVAYCRLAALDGAERDAAFDGVWASLPTATKVHLEFVGLVIDNAKRRGLLEQAQQVLIAARPYHLERSGEASEDFEKLWRHVEGERQPTTPSLPALDNGKEDIDVLRSHYQEILQSRPEEIVRVVCSTGALLHEFLGDMLLLAVKEFSLRLLLFSEKINRDENRYNDFVLSLLRMRLGALCWSVSDQPRGGRSSSGDEAGERDGVVQAPNAGELAIFEALRLSYVNKSYIDEHVEKAAIKYNPHGVPFVYVLIYFEGSDWGGFWDKYLDHVEGIALDGLTLVTSDRDLDNVSTMTNIRRARFVYRRAGLSYPFVIYHMAIHMQLA